MTAPAENIDEKLKNLSAGFDYLRNTEVKERIKKIKKLRKIIADSQLEICKAVSLDTGKDEIEILMQEVTPVLAMISYFEKNFKNWLKVKRFRYLRPGFWGKRNRIIYEPLGAITIIGPSNFPFSLIVMQTAFAFLCGNTVALKPSEKSAATNEMLKQIFERAKLLEKYISVFDGKEKTVESLISDERIKKVVFTGSYETGKKIAELAGKHFKPCILELGGCGSALVTKDANIDLAAKGIAWSSFYGKMNSCIGTKRIFVDANIHGTFMNKFRKYAYEYGLKDEVDDSLILNDKDNLLNVKVNEECKSKLKVFKFTNVNEAIENINDGRYGLSASVWHKKMRAAKEIAGRLNVGMVWINDASAGIPGFPWGGNKQSGWGRIFSEEGVYELTATKAIGAERRRLGIGKFWNYPYTNRKKKLLLAINKFFYG